MLGIQNTTRSKKRTDFFIPLLSSVEPGGEIHYNFQRPRSFTPLTSYVETYSGKFKFSDHIYHLPFDLIALEQIDFYAWNDTLTYAINGVQYFHEMLAALDDFDEFYRQPKFLVLNNECELKIERIGDTLAVCHD